MPTDRTKTSRPLRAGVVGFGWAGKQHMLGYHTSPDTQLVAIAGLEADLGAELATRYAVPAVYPDLDAMLANAALDVVSIATPTALHAPLAVAALDAGVHVFSEKPMAESSAAAEQMVSAARRNGKVLEVCYNHRGHGTVQALRRAIDAGMLGRIYYTKAGWVRRQGIPGLGTWFTRKDAAGGGPFMDIGVHVLDMAMYLLDEPTPLTVSASTYAEFGPRGRGGARSFIPVSESGAVDYEVEDLATAFVRLADGGTLLVETSWAQWIPHDKIYVDVYGSEGGAHLEWGTPETGERGTLAIFTELHGEPATVTPALAPPGLHLTAVQGFIDIVRSGEWTEADGRTSLTRMRLIDAAYASAELGREVSLSD